MIVLVHGLTYIATTDKLTDGATVADLQQIYATWTYATAMQAAHNSVDSRQINDMYMHIVCNHSWEHCFGAPLLFSSRCCLSVRSPLHTPRSMQIGSLECMLLLAGGASGSRRVSWSGKCAPASAPATDRYSLRSDSSSLVATTTIEPNQSSSA